ncbi:hypothetical protein COUCH_14865 [Couchioplanes caeruleus]|uniref:hypothetical protein n=1 Tax=Couchioplanes caeruleus TaxID=56438 RepID=UPI0020BFC05A|nr:hypothetical protein [Couchioplanes caeruleus]UQU67468.1 hypothetical protein COUCH_14865 [Couchioplanes caeruleus]
MEPAAAPRDVDGRLDRIGVRQVVRESARRSAVLFDPRRYRCATLAAELADEWVDYAELARLSTWAVVSYWRTLRRFAAYADLHSDEASALSLGKDTPDLAGLIHEWSRSLTTEFAEGSRSPANYSNALRTLIRFRAEREGTTVASSVQRLVARPISVPFGRTDELDEFTRQEKQALVRLAWEQVRMMERRLARGRSLIASASGHPAEHGWRDPANLLWALDNGRISFQEIRPWLPRLNDASPVLIEIVEQGGGRPNPRMFRFQLMVALAALLYPRHEDLQAFRLLLVAATGHAPEEITRLHVKGVEFTPSGVRLTMDKRRAGWIRHRQFDGPGPASHTEKGSLNAPELLRRLLAATEKARRALADAASEPVFLRGSVTIDGTFTIAPFASNGSSASSFGRWVADRGLSVSKPVDVRRMRKSVKVEKAIARRGVVADIADDHTYQTFMGHYAHGTTLHVISGCVVNRAQHRWLSTALHGPLVVDDEAAADLDDPTAQAALGISHEQAEQIIAGHLDMGVTSCRDPFDSPYSKAGELCAVAPLRCLECSNAFILPSNLPQLLLFAQHLERLRLRLSPRHFHTLWGQSHANLDAVFDGRKENEIALARRQIEEQGLTLQLPLAAHAEFDQ